MTQFHNTGRLKIYEADSSEEYREYLYQLETARSTYAPTRDFFVDLPDEGHNDFLISQVQSARDYIPKVGQRISLK
ncbi:MAG TPA: hypothetical protein VJ488_04385 [Dehalococcoidia bacterium]|nr:hypothetical protein [Dehalococcoidia bacterium]